MLVRREWKSLRNREHGNGPTTWTVSDLVARKLECIIEEKRHTITENKETGNPKTRKTRHEERNPDNQMGAHLGTESCEGTVDKTLRGEKGRRGVSRWQKQPACVLGAELGADISLSQHVGTSPLRSVSDHPPCPLPLSLQ